MSARADAVLLRWGEWTAQRERSCLGFPKECLTFRLSVSCPGFGSAVLVDSEVMAVDGVVAALRNDRPELFFLAFLWYVFQMPVSVICSKAKCSERTFHRRKQELLAAISTVL